MKRMVFRPNYSHTNYAALNLHMHFVRAMIAIQELQESSSRKRVEIEEVDGRLQQEYESRLADSLLEMRNENEELIRLNRAEIETLYGSKVCTDCILDHACSRRGRMELYASSVKVRKKCRRLSVIAVKSFDLYKKKF